MPYVLQNKDTVGPYQLKMVGLRLLPCLPYKHRRSPPTQSPATLVACGLSTSRRLLIIPLTEDLDASWKVSVTTITAIDIRGWYIRVFTFNQCLDVATSRLCCLSTTVEHYVRIWLRPVHTADLNWTTYRSVQFGSWAWEAIKCWVNTT